MIDEPLYDLRYTVPHRAVCSAVYLVKNGFKYMNTIPIPPSPDSCRLDRVQGYSGRGVIILGLGCLAHGHMRNFGCAVHKT